MDSGKMDKKVTDSEIYGGGIKSEKSRGDWKQAALEQGAAAIVLAAGKGSRMGAAVKKQYLDLEGKPVLFYSLKAFEESPVERIVLVTGQEEAAYCRKEIVERYNFRKVISVVAGGRERYHSVYAGLQELERQSIKPAYILIHDGARPFLDQALIERVLQDAKEYGACVAAMPVKDTIKIADSRGFASETPDRTRLFQVQTPQAFLYRWIFGAYEKLMIREEYQRGITDDAMVLETMEGRAVKLTEGSYENIKVTTPEDMEVAAAILRRRESISK